MTASSYTLTGPASGSAGVGVGPFTLNPVGGGYIGTITVSDGAAGGSFSLTQFGAYSTTLAMQWGGESTPKTFWYKGGTNGSGGARTVAATASPALGTDPTLAYAAKSMILYRWYTAPTGPNWSANWSDVATWGGTNNLPAKYYPGIPFAIANISASPTPNGSGGSLIRLTLAGAGIPSGTNTWATGDTVVVDGVTGTTEANGLWAATMVSATVWDLQGSTFTNAYVSGGQIVRTEGVIISSGTNGTLTLDAPAKVGDYGITGYYPLQSGGGMNLNVAGGQTLTMRGTPYINGTSLCSFSPGFTLILDYGPLSTVNYFSMGLGLTMGSPGTTTRSTVQVVGYGGGTHGMGGFNGTNPSLQCYAVDFFGLGSASASAWNWNTAGGASLVVDNCTFSECGLISAYADETVNFRLTNTKFINTANSGNPIDVRFTTIAPNGSPGARIITGNIFDLPPNFSGGVQGIVLNGNYFDNGLAANPGTTSWASFDSNFHRDSGSTNWCGQFGDATNNYYLKDGAHNNNHFLPGWIGATTLDRNIFEAPLASYLPDGGSDAFGDCLGTTGTTDAATIRMTRNLFLPIYPGDGVPYDGNTATQMTICGTMITVRNSSPNQNITYEHNTGYGVINRGFMRIGEGDTAAATHQMTSLRGNLFVIPNGITVTNSKIADQGNNATPDVIYPSTTNYNGSYNLNATGVNKYALPLTVANTGLGVGDVDADPQFVDPMRNLCKWAIARGYTATTNPATLTDWQQVLADARRALKVDLTRITDLMAYVRAGFRPQNAAFSAATYPGDPMATDAAGNSLGGTIGAMANQAVPSTSYTLTGPTSGLPGVPSKNFTVTPSWTFTGTITPNDGGAGGTFSPTSLSWTAAANAQSFTYSPNSSGSCTISTSSSPSQTSPPGIVYTVTSSLVSGTVSVSNVGSTSLTISTTPASGGTSLYTYLFQRGAGTTGPWLSMGAASPSTTATDTGLTPGSTYRYRCIASDSVGDTATTASVSVATVSALSEPGISASAPVVSAAATLTGVTAAGGVGPYTYQWHRSSLSGFVPSGVTAVAGQTSLVFNDTGLSPGATYYYRLRATDASGATGDSPQAVVVVPPTGANASRPPGARVTGSLTLIRRFPGRDVPLEGGNYHSLGFNGAK